jgi:hypothetical protein
MPNQSPYQLGPHGEMNGSDILVQVETPADSGNYVTVGSQRGATFGETTAPIDMNSKEDRRSFINPGRWSSTISFEYLYISTSSGYARLKAASRDGEYVRLRRRERGTDIEIAECVVTSLSEAAPDQEAVIVSAEFQLNGGWEEVP